LNETVNSSCGFTIPNYINQYGVYTIDNCDANPIIYQDPSPGVIITTPTTIVIYTIDSESNISACGFTITPVDNTVPVITTCVSDQIVTADATCQFALADYTGMIVASDNCDASLDITQDPIAGQLVAGTTTITITVMDDTGNMSTCTFDVIVEDTTAPSIVSCAPAVTESVNSVCEFILPDYTSLVVANDNCDLDLTYSQLPLPGTVFSG
jgi:hypothetical protein